MKKGLCVLGCMMVRLFGFGQAQEIQQLTMDLEKLAQMKSMLSSMYKGYTTLTNGYNQITSLAKGNFDLHKNYLDGLLAISPTVRKYKKIESIISTQLLLVKESKAFYSKIRTNGLFNSNELIQVNEQYNQIINSSLRNLDELSVVLTPGALRMQDDERIAAIDRMDLEMQAALKELRSFNETKNAVLIARQRIQRDVNISRQIIGIK